MMELDQAKQLKELQKENARLKRMLADEMLGKELLKEALEKNGKPRSQTTDRSVTVRSGPMHRPRGVPALRVAPQYIWLCGQGARCLDGETEDSPAPAESPLS